MLRKIRLAAALLFFTMITLLFWILLELCMVGLAGWRNTVPSCRAGIECGGGDSPCFVDSAFGACLLFGYLSVRGVSRYHFLGFGKGKEESFPLLACFVVVTLWGIGSVCRRFGSRGGFIGGVDCSLQCIRPYRF